MSLLMRFENSSRRQMIWLCVALSISCLATFHDLPAAGADMVPLRLMPPSPAKKALLIFTNESEAETATEACDANGLKFDVASQFDTQNQNYAAYHTVICGSNQMDYFGHKETQKPEAFAPLVKFVEAGGHLIIMGVFNGRNTEHLRQFGITCGFQHCDNFTTTPASAMFFKGCEKLIPANKKMRSVGNIYIIGAHVAILNRGAECDSSQPAMVTLARQRGRLTFNLVEPHWQKDLWLITATLNWVARGAPTPGHPGAEDSLLPVPDATALAAAEILLHEALAKDYAKISQPAGKLNWARLMLERDFSEETDLAVRYVAWSEARETAAAVGELELALQAVDLLGVTYQVNALNLKLESLTAVSRGVRESATMRSAARIVCDLMAQEISDDHFHVVPQIAVVGRTLAQKSQEKHLQTLVTYYDKRAKTLDKEFQKVAPVKDLIKQSSPSEASCTTMGRFDCFVKSDWRQGLPLLAMGDDPILKSLAERELALPVKAADHVAIADGWWEISESLPVDQRGIVQRHAGDWYYKALPELMGGLQNSIKTKLSKIPSGKAQLTVQIVRHQGVSHLTLTPEHFRFQILSEGPPDALRINDQKWEVKQKQLRNEGATRLLADNIDINAAKVTPIRGRGSVQLKHTSEGLVVIINDPPDGGDNYEFKLTFGGK